MKRKAWKKLAAVIGAAAMGMTLLYPAGMPSEVKAEEASAAESERKIDFNKDWKFYLETDGSVDAYKKDYDDSGWRELDLPHDYSIEQNFDPSSPSGANGGYLNGGVGWYRKSFVLPAEMEGKRISVSFGGVYMDSTIYVNGKMVGNYPYGYSPFAYDITDFVTADGVSENVISVKVNHQQPSSRWYSGSGIYRGVDLVVTDPVHVARYGTYVTTPDLEEEYASDRAAVHIETTVENETTESEEVKVRTTIYDSEGNVFKEPEETKVSEISAGDEEVFSQDIITSKPELWDTENPNLYTVKTEVVTEDQVVDTYDTTFGFRWVTMDPDEGFYLNGEYMKLHGMCMHHDQGALGAVSNYRAIERQMETLKEMGVNAVRVTHNPASDELLEICNKMGLLVIDEAFDCWESSKRSMDYARFFGRAATHPDAEPGETWAEFDLKNMVSRGKNDPCIIMWSIGNEIINATVDTAKQLVGWVKEIDQTRPVTQGFNNFLDGFYDESMKAVAAETDVVGFNYGERSYDAAHEEYPDWLIMGSETSSAVRSRGYYIIDDEKKIRSNYDDGNTVGWGCSAEAAWKADRDRKFVLGEFVWTGFDYIGEPSPYHEQWPAKSSYFGAVDTAGIPKDAYYLYQSQWVDAEEHPMVHLLPHWNWENDDSIKEDGRIRVQAYSNAASVELILNGESLGEKQFLQKETADGRPYQEAEDGHIYLEWMVEYEPGRLEAVARDLDGNVIATDVVETSEEPAAVELTADREVITADGQDLSYITVDIVDDEGRLVPVADNRVNFQISGNGRIVGVDNGNQTEVEDSYKGNTRKAFSGKAMVIVQSTEESGSFTLKASSPGLKSTEVTVFTAEDSDEVTVVTYDECGDVYTEIGVNPELPEKVTALYSDGNREEKSVVWEEIDEESLNTPGLFTLQGQVEDTGDKIEINVVVTDIIGIRDTTAVTDIGVIPELPDKVAAVTNAGTESEVEVQWDEVTEEMVAEEGIITVQGTVHETSYPAKAVIRVVQGVTGFTKDIARRDGTYPVPTASYEQENGNDPVEAINNGNVVYTGGAPGERWIAWGHGEEEEWIQLEFETTHIIGKTGIDFWTNIYDSLMGTADRITIEYSLDGQTWTPVENQSISTKEEFITDGENVIEFTPVEAKFIRWNFYSADRLAQGVSEVHVYEEETVLPVSSDASLSDLQLNGVTIEGFDPEQYYYTVPLEYPDEVPAVTAMGAEYASVFTVQALSGNHAAVVSVVAEDGVTRNDYVIQFERALPQLDRVELSMESTQLTQDDIADITVKAVLQDGRTAGSDEIVMEYVLGNPEIAQIQEDRLYAYYPGDTTLKAVVTYNDRTVESSEMNIHIAENPNPPEVTAYENVHVTTGKGIVPVLPGKIRAVFKDGLPKQVNVDWEEITQEQCMEYGEFRVQGTVEGQALKAEAVILVRGVMGVQHFSTAVPVGVVPGFPERARIYYSDGTENEAQIEWEEHPQELFMTDGEIVTVKGTVSDQGEAFETSMKVRVSSESYNGDKFTGYKNGFYWPLGIASFTNGQGVSGDNASELNDNIISRETDANNRWTNWDPSWRESDWAGIIFGFEEVTYRFIDHLEIDFYTDYGAAVPAEVEIQYYDGEYFNAPPQDPNNVTEDHPTGIDENWKPVANLQAPDELNAEKTNVFTFDPVETCAIRAVMKAQDGKCLAVTEMGAYEKLTSKSSEAVLTGILVNGKPIEGFETEEHEYEITADTMPEITAQVSGNESVTVVSPSAFGEQATIIVTAEDGVTAERYYVTVNKDETPEDPSDTVDKTALNMVIAMAEKLEAEQTETSCYTEETWAAVQTALDTARALAADENASQEDVDNAFLELITVANLLENAVQSVGLQAAIEGVRAILEDAEGLEQYTPESVEALRTALTEAERVYAEESADQETINAAARKLMDAVTSLVVVDVDTRLDILIRKAEELLADSDQYTSESIANLQAALDAAKLVADDRQASDEAINEAYSALAEAMTSLVRKADKSELKTALDKADAILADSGRYVEETITRLQAAADAAQAVYDKEDASTAEVGEAVKSLVDEILKARLLGDVDGNGAVDSADSAEVLKYAAEAQELDDVQGKAADVNRDGATDSTDAAAILEYAAEQTETF